MCHISACSLSVYMVQTENNEHLPKYTNTPLPENVGVMFTALGHVSAPICMTSSNIGPNIIDMHACMVYSIFIEQKFYTTTKQPKKRGR
jgi:hypothetical protein